MFGITNILTGLTDIKTPELAASPRWACQADHLAIDVASRLVLDAFDWRIDTSQKGVTTGRDGNTKARQFGLRIDLMVTLIPLDVAVHGIRGA